MKLKRNISTIQHLVGLVITLFLFGCSPKIDTTSTEAYEISVQHLRSQLDETETIRFDTALRNANCRTRYATVQEVEFALSNPDQYVNFGNVYDCTPNTSLNGMTASEIIASYERLYTPNGLEPYSASFTNIANTMRNRIAKKKHDAEVRLQEAEDFFKKIDLKILPLNELQDEFILKIHNTSDSALRSIEIDIDVRGKGRQISYFTATCNLTFEGGLEPEEIYEKKILKFSAGEILDSSSLDFELGDINKRRDQFRLSLSDPCRSITTKSLKEYGVENHRLSISRIILANSKSLPASSELKTDEFSPPSRTALLRLPPFDSLNASSVREEIQALEGEIKTFDKAFEIVKRRF